MVGDTVPATAGTVTIVAHVINAPAHVLRFVVDGRKAKETTILTLDQAVKMKVNAAALRRIRAEAFLRKGYWMGALTSPIYFA